MMCPLVLNLFLSSLSDFCSLLYKRMCDSETVYLTKRWCVFITASFKKILYDILYDFDTSEYYIYNNGLGVGNSVSGLDLAEV